MPAIPLDDTSTDGISSHAAAMKVVPGDETPPGDDGDAGRGHGPMLDGVEQLVARADAARVARHQPGAAQEEDA